MTICGSSVRMDKSIDIYWADAFRRTSRMFGVEALPVVRHFSPTGLTHWDGHDFRSIPNTTHIIHSFRKFDRSAFNDWLRLMPVDRYGRVAVIYQPEPWDEINKTKQFTAEHLRWVQGQMRDAISASGMRGKIFNASCLTGWDIDPRSGHNYMEMLNVKALDLLTFDPYNTMASKGKLMDPEMMFGQSASLARQLGRPWAIAEFGTPLTPRIGDFTDEQVAAWFADLMKFARLPGNDRAPARYVCYWQGVVPSSGSEPEKNYLVDPYPVLQQAWAKEVQYVTP